MTQARSDFFWETDLWKLGRERLFSHDDAKIDICESGAAGVPSSAITTHYLLL